MQTDTVRVLHVFGKMNRGGAEMRTLEVISPLQEKGIHFDFCTLGEGPGVLDEKIHSMGGEVINCPLNGGIRRFSDDFYQMLQLKAYDFVHSHVYYFSGKILQLAHRAGVPGRIAHFRTIHDGKKKTLFRVLYHFYMRHLINKHATNILAVCKGAMEHSWGPRWTKDPRCKVIYNGFDLRRFDYPPETRKDVCRELGLSDNSKLLINVGSFTPAKAHDILLLALSKILCQRADVHLLLAGEGKLKDELTKKAVSLKIKEHVHFLGLRQDVPRLLKASDCFVLSSRREGLPGVVIEAIAAGLPVAATDLPGVREIAGFSRSVRVVPLENAQKLSDAILDILSNSGRCRSEADAFLEAFDLNTCVNSFYEIYTSKIRR